MRRPIRLLSIFRKTLREQSRDLWVLALSLVAAPFFVVLYWLLFVGGSTAYGVLVLNADRGAVLADGTMFSAGDELVAGLEKVTYASGSPLLRVRRASDLESAKATLANRDAALLLVLPEDFSRGILAFREATSGGDGAPVGGSDGPSGPPAAPTVTFIGDLTSAAYAVSSVLTLATLDEYLQAATGQTRPVELAEEPLGASGVRTEFETYVPGLLILSVTLLIFLAAMTVAREVETGAVRRLRVTPMTSFDLLAGISLNQVLVGVTAVLLTFGTAYLFGFRSQGPLWVAILVGAVTTLSVVGLGLVVAAFSRGVTDAFVIGNFPLIFLMFFSGAIYPLPRTALFTLGGHAVAIYDFIPATHAVVALNKVLTLGAGLGQVAYELIALVALSAVYFAAGVWLFQRRHLRRS